MLTLGIKQLLLGISIAITEAAYPLIKRLYDLFMYLATFKFFSNSFIKNVWNNLYVLVGVVVLFAIAIKLISAMVNPDTMSDNKKGVKGAYFRAVFAVVFIFVFPMVFELSYKVQEELLTNNFLTRTVFGYEVEANKSVGQILAWETFSTFCTPVTTTSNNTKTPLLEFELDENDPIFDTYYTLEDDIDNIGLFAPNIYALESVKAIGGAATGLAITKNTFGTAAGVIAAENIEILFEYSDLLCPLAGILIVYELILLCMDTVFRAAKIALLEIMLPIVLGAYVFNPEILKKWAKEFFSTYISVFLKVLAIGFMILALEALKGVVF